MTMQLFLVVLGGRIEGCHIELHDVRFVVGTSIEDTLPQLRQQWFGRRRGLHIDSWLAVRAVAGWLVELRSGPSAGPERLCWVLGKAMVARIDAAVGWGVQRRKGFALENEFI
jgi:hypothetical protein